MRYQKSNYNSNGAARICAIHDSWQFKTHNFLFI